MVNNNHEFVHLNKNGISVASLSDCDKRLVLGNDSQQKIIHSLESVNYLKVDPGNFIEFDAESGERVIKI